jgi:hypothetical protein
MTAPQTSRSLSDEQKKILKERQFAGSRPLEDLITLIEPLALHDEGADKWRWAFGCAAPFAYAATGISAVLTLMIPALGIPLVIFLTASIALTIAKTWLGRFDLSNNVRGLALPFFMDLKEKAPGSRIEVTLDLRPPNHQSKVLLRKKPYRGGGYWRVVETHFHDPWFKGTARLTDGGTLQWNVEDLLIELRRYEVRRRSNRRSGRSLLARMKYSRQSMISVRLSLPRKDYVVVEASGTTDVEVEQTALDINVNIVRKHESETIEPPPASILLDAVAEAYRQVRPASQEMGP